MGGPKDTLAPVFLSSIPENKSIRFTGNEIRITYNETLKLDNLTKELIITPIGELEFDYVLKKNSIVLKFSEPFNDSTTYTLNFQSAIKDITEGNISADNIFSFSTGDFIDSIRVTGNVLELLTNLPKKDITVGIYSVYDTLDLFNGRPLYFSKTDDKGIFKIENIKSSSYFLYYFNDANSNLKCDLPREAYGFLTDTIFLLTNLDSLKLKIHPVDIRDISIQKAVPSGLYFEIGLNKPIINYDFVPFDSSLVVFHNFIDGQKGIRVYNTFPADSTGVLFFCSDSVSNFLTDTLYIKFQESKRKKEDFTYTVTPGNNEPIELNYVSEILFNKPVITVNFDSLYIRYDSANQEKISEENIKFNKTQDRLIITKQLNQEIISTLNEKKQIGAVPKTQGGRAAGSSPKPKIGFGLYMGVAAFISIENDSSTLNFFNYQLKKEEDYGIISGKINTSFTQFSIQLLDKKYKVLGEIKNLKNYTFRNIKPGDYYIRILVDENNNGLWDPPNFIIKKQYENVLIYPDVLTLRENWELRDINFEF